MQMSRLISIWYEEFCIKRRTPKPDFATFKSLMVKFYDDVESVMEYYEENFAKTPKKERKSHD